MVVASWNLLRPFRALHIFHPNPRAHALGKLPAVMEALQGRNSTAQGGAQRNPGIQDAAPSSPVRAIQVFPSYSPNAAHQWTTNRVR